MRDSPAEPFRIETSADAMGSTYSIILYGYDRVKMEAAIEAAFDEVRRLDETLSNYLPGSEWSMVNRHAAQRAVEVSPELFQLLFLPGIQPAKRGSLRYQRGPVNEDLGFL